MSNGENSTEPKRANIIIINRLSESFPLYHLHQLSARSASHLRCVCARALAARVREKWAKAPPHSKKKKREKKRKSKLIHTSQFWQEEKNRSVYEPYK